MFNKLTKLIKLKSLRNKIDRYQYEIIGISGYPNGDHELQKQIVEKLEQKMKESLQEYKNLTDTL